MVVTTMYPMKFVGPTQLWFQEKVERLPLLRTIMDGKAILS